MISTDRLDPVEIDQAVRSAQQILRTPGQTLKISRACLTQPKYLEIRLGLGGLPAWIAAAQIHAAARFLQLVRNTENE